MMVRDPWCLVLDAFSNHAQNFVANRDVDVVRRATKGFGTDEASLINTLCNRTEKQLEAIDLLYHSRVS